MKYLKIYEEYNNIPDNFISLNSIGSVLDANNGIIYPMLRNGGYDEDNPFDIEHSSDNIEGISNEDMQVINKYYLSCESLVKDKINWNLIETGKDLSLDELDKGYDLFIRVFTESNFKLGLDAHLVYFERFSHDSEVKNFLRYFPNNMGEIKNCDNFYYNFSFQNNTSHLSDVNKMNKKLEERLSKMFPVDNRLGMLIQHKESK